VPPPGNREEPTVPTRSDSLPGMPVWQRNAALATAFELPGYRVVKNLGMVRGIRVRSRSIFGTLGASLQTIVGGNITLFETMCEQTREQALELMTAHAAERGANAVVGVRYDATEVMQGVTEVIAYGTAVEVERAAS